LLVLVGARNPALGEAAAERLRGEGVDARYVQVDLTEPATITAAAADIESQEGRLDILVNNAGVSTPRRRVTWRGEVCERMKRDGGPVFPAPANPGDPDGPFEACRLMRTHAR